MTESTGKVKRTQPSWSPPVPKKEVPQLKLFNSLTRQKEVFVPQNGKQVSWYSCGPTVYDSSHMGHARSYISFDILRRVLSDYFNYDVLYAMNITDVDDKIIKRARQNHLWEKYLAENKPWEEISKDITTAMKPFELKLQTEADPDKLAMYKRMHTKITDAVKAMETVLNNGQDIADARQSVLTASKDIIADWLDGMHGAEITDKSIFSKLSQHFEEEYHTDMDGLNVLPADVLTRVSEYIPENVEFIQKIIANGYGILGEYPVDKQIIYKRLKIASEDNGMSNEADLAPQSSTSSDMLCERLEYNVYSWIQSITSFQSWITKR